MTPQERQLVDDLFDRLAKLESAPRDPDATAAIQEGLRKRAQCGLRAGADRAGAGRGAEARRRPHPGTGSRRMQPEQTQSGGFLDSMRDTIFGKDSQPRGSVPNVRAAEFRSRPVWNIGQVLQQAPGPRQASMIRAIRPGLRPRRLWQGGYGKAAASASMAPRASAAAARSSARRRQPRPAWSAARCCSTASARMMGGGGHHQAFGDTGELNSGSWRQPVERSIRAARSPATPASTTSAARTGAPTTTTCLFDQAAIDRQQDADQDAMDLDSDDFGSDDDDSDYA